MQGYQMQAGLFEAADLLDSVSARTVAREVRALARALDAGRAQPVGKLIPKVLDRWRMMGRPAVYPSDLKSFLEKFESVVLAVSGSKFANDVQALLNLLNGKPGADVETFARDLADALCPLDSTALVRSFVNRFHATRFDSRRFDEVFELLKEMAARSGKAGLNKKQLNAISEAFLGYDGKYKTKDAAFEAIRRRQLQDAIQASKERLIDRLGV